MQYKFCNGILDKIGKWKCSPCHLGKSNFVKCQLCLQKGGAMKPTDCNKWVHVICALFTSGVTFLDDITMEPIDISNVSPRSRNKMCSFCYSTQGFCSTCPAKKCKNRLHVTCGQKNQTLKEIIDPENDNIKFYAYCKDHKPKDSSRRVSSESVKNAAQNRRNENSKNGHALQDANWILDAVKSHSTPAKTASKRSCKHIIIMSLKFHRIETFCHRFCLKMMLHLKLTYHRKSQHLMNFRSTLHSEFQVNIIVSRTN